MNKSKTTETAATPAARYDVFVVDNYTDRDKQEKSTWMRIGVAFPHKDGQGFSVELLAVPTNGKLVIRQYEDKPQ